MDITREPIIKTRTSIRPPRKLNNNKCSSCNININYDKNKSLIETTDCTGTNFIYVNKLSNVSKRVITKYLESAEIQCYFYINVGYLNNLKFVEWLITTLTSKDISMYLETDRDLPNELLKVLSNNPFNIIQCNLSELSNSRDDYSSKEEYERIKNLRTLPHRAKIHGLYVILCIDPILPQVSHLENILTTLVAEKNSYNHIIIKFGKIRRTIKDPDYIPYTLSSGKAINLDTDYFSLNLNTNTWECAKWYRDLILEDINYLVKVDNISICGATKNCRGIKLSYIVKTEKGGFKIHE